MVCFLLLMSIINHQSFLIINHQLIMTFLLFFAQQQRASEWWYRRKNEVSSIFTLCDDCFPSIFNGRFHYVFLNHFITSFFLAAFTTCHRHSSSIIYHGICDALSFSYHQIIYDMHVEGIPKLNISKARR